MAIETTDQVLEKLREIGRQNESAPDPSNLTAWRIELEKSAHNFELLGQQFKLKANQFREKIKAIDTLLGQTSSPIAEPVPGSSAREAEQTGSEEVFTPTYVYWPAILESLTELGGRARRESVIELVGTKLHSILTSADKEILPSGLDVRWKNRVAWQRLNMVNQGLLHADSPRGIWEITEVGYKWLADNTNAMAALHLHARIRDLCRKSAVNCDVKIVPSSIPDHFRLKVTDAGIVILGPDFDICISASLTKSEDQLWDFLESISNRRIRRPAVENHHYVLRNN